MILGTPTKLTSQFRLTYNMILNLLRVEALRVEEMIKRSFSENASQRLLPDQQKLVTEGEKELLNLPHLDASPRVEAVRRFYDLSSRLVELNAVVVTHALEHSTASKIFVPGRVLVLRDHVRWRGSQICLIAQHFPGVASLLIRSAPPQADAAGVLSRDKHFFVLAAVTQEIKSGARDVDVDAVAPRWPCSVLDPGPDVVYELRLIPASSIALVTRFVQKVLARRSSALTG